MTAPALLRQVTLATMVSVLCIAGVLRAQTADYVTDEEEDLIRDAQGLKDRVPLFIKLLDNRIVALGLRERTAKEREQAKKDLERYEMEVKEASKVKDAAIRAKPLRPDVYLRNTSRSELLRGYMQVTDELLDNIDDAYERKFQVREYVVELEKFLSEQMPRLRKFESRTAAEAAAIKEAITHSDRAIEDCRKAMESLPKTERISR